MPEKLLDLFEGHPAFEQRGRDGVTEQVRIDARRDARERRRFLHNLQQSFSQVQVYTFRADSQ